MIKNYAKILFLILAVSVSAQNVDSLYNLYISSINYSNDLMSTGETKPKLIKCGMSLIHSLKENYYQLSPQKQNNISSILNRPQTHTSIISPSGYFRVHYDTSGFNEVKYDIDEFAEALDSSYSFEINFLGYPAPPTDNGAGGDDGYDVYIQDLGSIYGYTDFVSSEMSASFMVVDNDFAIHYTKGIDGAKVTAAHEFHHAIQVGSYKYRADDAYFYEIISTSMEEFVYDSINDYYAYIDNYYNNAQAPFYATFGGGYDLAIWNIFLQKKYGYGVIKSSLQNVINYPALQSIAAAISEFGGSFQDDLMEFGIWNYFTGSRAKSGEYFEEAANYPKIKPFVSSLFTPNYESVTISSNPSSNTYIRYVDLSRGLPDTLVTFITNSDIQSNERTEFDYTVYSYEADGASKINELYWSKLSSRKMSLFSETVIFNNELAIEGQTERKEIDYSYPQPFEYSKHNYVYIPTSADPSGKSYLNVYTTAMDLVFSDEKDIFASDKIVVRWDGKKNNGEKLPTGIYIYVTKSGDNIKKGKIVIYNE